MTALRPAPPTAAPPPPGPGTTSLSTTVAPGPSGRLSRWLCAAGAVGLTAGGMAFLYNVDPNAANNPYPRCLLKQLTGIDCPGCGGTRAVYSLLHGDVAGAADHNVLAFVALPLIAYLVARFVLARFEIDLPAPRMTRSLAWAMVAVTLVFTLVRNIPGWPLYYLNSTAG
jgi:hypothetical protein